MKAKHTFLVMVVCVASVLVSVNAHAQSGQAIKIKYEKNGYLDQSIVESVRDEQMRVKAISAFEYALPIVGLAQWCNGVLSEGAYGDWVIYESRATKIPIITANTTTPYVVTCVDLAKSS